jgi:broad specificity phosphatase PhoE
MATRFFNNPTQSIEGWERAIDAQARIVRAIKSLTNEDSTEGDIAIVSHGGVGTLLLCYLSRSAIDRSMDQPGGGGGNYFSFDRESLKLIHGWRPFENAPAD